ncbi:MAG: AlpA family transcriptional regulator [Gammaproteobacteria bacterium]|nr:AlpA family transcriptional regulator [Gammaproteobacteria bacterium]MBU0821856.1 AlpA family transcriptional regulator [Gammaproteobacteria bacterium]MBU0843969.1 AlpA family transcriptional regulator [Gammaproteobacteria bacterium]MBU1842220.1 AlpA family transcriptional regulator [Gammaproteobacteria bacterium]
MNTARDDQHEEPVEFIRLPEVKKLCGLSTATIYRMAVSGAFPKQVKLGASAVAWVKSEVVQWSTAKLAASRGNQSADATASR